MQADLVGVNKDSYLILDTLPPEYDARVKAMEVDEKPEERYTDVGGLDKQMEELVEAIVRRVLLFAVCCLLFAVWLLRLCLCWCWC